MLELPLRLALRIPDNEPLPERIQSAFDLAVHAHEGAYRGDGSEFVTHPVEVAVICANVGADEDTIIAALLHDTVEDTAVTLEKIEAMFGQAVAQLVAGVTKLEAIETLSKDDAKIETYRRILLAAKQDWRVLLLKLGDRLHNARTLGLISQDRQERIAHETVTVYVPLAHRIGMGAVASELEDICLSILEPDQYAEIQGWLDARKDKNEQTLQQMRDLIGPQLDRMRVEADIQTRTKRAYSLRHKMIRSGKPLSQIEDIVGMRIIVDEVATCYQVLGLVHSLWKPLQQRFDDYIAIPKRNGYQSLHTTVIGPQGRLVEVQIRTHDMHAQATYGVAAHHDYKQSAGVGKFGLDALIEAGEQDEGAEAFWHSLTDDLGEDPRRDMIIQTPRGDSVLLPVGSTPIDFAYAIHSDLGHKMHAVRVNGESSSPMQELQPGDTVEIFTGDLSEGPQPDWLYVAATHRARAQIRRFLAHQQRTNAVSDGRQLLHETLVKEQLKLGPHPALARIASEAGLDDPGDFFRAIAAGTLPVLRVARRYEGLSHQPADVISTVAVIVEGSIVDRALCPRCLPIAIDDIHVDEKLVHRVGCDRIHDGHTGQWQEQDQPSAGIVTIRVEGRDRPGLGADITGTLVRLQASIVHEHGTTREDACAMQYTLLLADVSRLPHLLAALRAIAGVFDADRLPPCATS